MIETYVEKGRHQGILSLIHTRRLRRDHCWHILAFYAHLMIGVIAPNVYGILVRTCALGRRRAVAGRVSGRFG